MPWTERCPTPRKVAQCEQLGDHRARQQRRLSARPHDKSVASSVPARRSAGAPTAIQAQASCGSQTEQIAPLASLAGRSVSKRDMLRVPTDRQTPSRAAATAAAVRDVGRGGSQGVARATTRRFQASRRMYTWTTRWKELTHQLRSAVA